MKRRRWVVRVLYACGEEKERVELVSGMERLAVSQENLLGRPKFQRKWDHDLVSFLTWWALTRWWEWDGPHCGWSMYKILLFSVRKSKTLYEWPAYEEKIGYWLWSFNVIVCNRYSRWAQESAEQHLGTERVGPTYCESAAFDFVHVCQKVQRRRDRNASFSH